MKKYIISSLFVIPFLFVNCVDKDYDTITLKKNDDTYLPSVVQPVLNDIQRKSFNYFYEGADKTTGLAFEGTERGDVLTTGGTGFGLMSLIIGAERGWISRTEATDRTLMICEFLQKCERFNGVWSHWYTADGKSADFGDQIKTGDLVETGLLVQGLIAAKEYYNGSSASERKISTIVENLWSTINWKFYTNSEDVLYWLWYSQTNNFSLPVNGWNEAWTSYIFALAAPSPNNISTDVYKKGWEKNGAYYHDERSFYGYSLPLGSEAELGGPLFLSQYSMLALNPKSLADAKVNYWTQNANQTMINRHYCVYAAPKEFAYNEYMWGLSACYGVGSTPDYIARAPGKDDGVIATTAALSAYPYTPFYSTQALLHVSKLSYLSNTYGFGDSYKPSENVGEKRVLAIDQGPIVVMIENYRTGLIWDLIMKNEHVKKGLEIAGVSTNPTLKDGFHLAVINTETKVYDMLIHPDRGMYELDYYVNGGGTVKFIVKTANGGTVYESDVNAKHGANVFSFFDYEIPRGVKYKIEMIVGSDSYDIDVILR